MSATSWLIIAIVGFSLSGIALVAAVFMFIKMRIPAVIGDLSGKTVAREIQAMRESNASSGTKIHKSSRVNMDRGKLTEKVDDQTPDKSAMALAHSSKRLDKTPGTTSGSLSEEQKQTRTDEEVVRKRDSTTEHLSDNVAEVSLEPNPQEKQKDRKTAILTNDKATEVLSEARETEILSGNATEVLAETHETEILSNNATEVLSDYSETGKSGGTTVLSEENQESDTTTPVQFSVIRDLTEIHTDEIIK